MRKWTKWFPLLLIVIALFLYIGEVSLFSRKIEVDIRTGLTRSTLSIIGIPLKHNIESTIISENIISSENSLDHNWKVILENGYWILGRYNIAGNYRYALSTLNGLKGMHDIYNISPEAMRKISWDIIALWNISNSSSDAEFYKDYLFDFLPLNDKNVDINEFILSWNIFELQMVDGDLIFNYHNSEGKLIKRYIVENGICELH